MNNDKEKQIEEMAKIMLDGEIARERGEIDCSMYTWKDCIDVGIQRLAGATALYNAGYGNIKEFADKILALCKAHEKQYSHLCKSKKECHEETCRYQAVLRLHNEIAELLNELYGANKK